MNERFIFHMAVVVFPLEEWFCAGHVRPAQAPGLTPYLS